MNPFALRDLATPHSGRVRQASSAGRDTERGGTWCGLRPAPTLGKRVLLEPGETHTMALLPGAGLITRLWMTTLLPFNSHGLRSLVLRFYWDDEVYPSVECPFGDFFGAPFGGYVFYVAAPMSLTNGGFTCLWPMPYASGARLEVKNEGLARVDPLFYNITYYQLDISEVSDLRFHAQWVRENPTQPGIPYTILEAKGRGHYVGCHLFMQNREWWLRPPLRRMVFPYGFGMGMMEGWEAIYVDQEEVPSVSGTGTEDYFGGGWYFSVDGEFAAPYHGCTVRDYLRGRIAAYRFDVLAPVPFGESLRVTVDHGLDNQVMGDYTSVAYWYQREPHRPFPQLPETVARLPVSPSLNIIQAILTLGPLPLRILAFMWKLWKRLVW